MTRLVLDPICDRKSIFAHDMFNLATAHTPMSARPSRFFEAYCT
jgi:hypothetical protein